MAERYHRRRSSRYRGAIVEDALAIQKPAPDDAIVIRTAETKAA
jgi:hypothetical protein